jgi:anti-sigma regulatory factor (Ser/Thr protein kinase)
MTPLTQTPPESASIGSGRDLVSHRPATLERSFPATCEAPGSARRSLDTLARTVGPELLGVLRLLVSELVTNAVEHGSPSESSRVTLRLLVFPASIAAVVEDEGPGFREPPPMPDEDAIHGWGLHIVPELADRYGIETSPRTAVWFELERRDSGARRFGPS